MSVKTTNNAFGTLASDINNSVTTINLSGGQGAKFPSLNTGDYFYGTLIAVDNTTEIVKFTSRNTDALTVTRAPASVVVMGIASKAPAVIPPAAAAVSI